MFVAKESKGLHTSDECFKMAMTDAISVACKALGIGADVYWEKDKTKYTKPAQPAEQPNVPPKKDDSFSPTEAQRKKFYAMARERGLTDALKSKIMADYGLNSSAHLTADQITELIKWMEEQK